MIVSRADTAPDLRKQSIRVEAERIARDGVLPLNTHCGPLSAGQLHGYGFLHEACVQLWGEAGARQVPGEPEVGVACAGGGPLAGALLLTHRRWPVRHR